MTPPGNRPEELAVTLTSAEVSGNVDGPDGVVDMLESDAESCGSALVFSVGLIDERCEIRVRAAAPAEEDELEQVEEEDAERERGL